MHDNWIAFFAGVTWLAVFTAGLFALADWVQRRDRRRKAATSADMDLVRTTTPDRPECREDS